MGIREVAVQLKKIPTTLAGTTQAFLCLMVNTLPVQDHGTSKNLKVTQYKIMRLYHPVMLASSQKLSGGGTHL